MSSDNTRRGDEIVPPGGRQNPGKRRFSTDTSTILSLASLFIWACLRLEWEYHEAANKA